MANRCGAREQPEPGYYGDAGGMAATCPSNSYCPGGDAVPCPSNTISPAGAAAVTDCRPALGFWGLPGSPATLCSANYYCPAGAAAETACPANTQSPGASPPNDSYKHNIHAEEKTLKVTTTSRQA